MRLPRIKHNILGRNMISNTNILLDKVNQKGLEELLDQAHSRIAELETTQTRLNREINNLKQSLQQQFTAVSDTLSDTRYADWFVASRASRALTTLTPLQRREIWLSLCAQTKADGKFTQLTPHDGDDPQYRILVLATGGYGDLLYGTTVVRELFFLFNAPQICVIAENKACEEVYLKNGYVHVAGYFNSTDYREFAETSLCLDIFDLVVEIKYAVSYARPPASRIDNDFIMQANSQVAKWQHFVRGAAWPFRNNQLAKEATAQNLHQLDLVGVTSGLPIQKLSPLDFLFTSQYRDSQLLRKKYVTVHHGSDKNMVAANGLQTKNLSPIQWAKITKIAQDAGFAVVQLGTASEEQIHDVDLDLRGLLTLEDTAYLISCADTHIDTEGGLVHLARAVNTKSIVFFGPTPVNFFGYPQNINIAPMVCGDCWWMTKTWAQKCPIGHSEVPCMASHSLTQISDHLKSVKSEQLIITPSGQKSIKYPKRITDIIASNIKDANHSMIYTDQIDCVVAVLRDFKAQLSDKSLALYVDESIYRHPNIPTSQQPYLTPATAFCLRSEHYFDDCYAICAYPNSEAEINALSHLICQMANLIDVASTTMRLTLLQTESMNDVVVDGSYTYVAPIGDKYRLEGVLPPRPASTELALEMSFKVSALSKTTVKSSHSFSALTQLITAR
jgi:ADP-heptose:LPS heptosyltransferase